MSLDNMKALITGGAGYFGSLLVSRLLQNGWDCKVLDINNYNAPPEVNFVQGDILDPNILDIACNNVDVIFHNVAQVPLAKDNDLFNSVNITGTNNLLKSAKNLGVRKVIYTSSSAVYGVPSQNPVTEIMIPTPMENYGKAKYQAEKICQEYIGDDFDVTIIRPRTILGHGRLGIFQILFEWIRTGNNIPVLGDGNNIYQFVHADDLAEAILLSANSNIKSGLYNCGAEEYGTMREALENLCEFAGTGSKVKSVPFRLATFGMELTSKLGLSPLGAYHSLMYGRSMYFDNYKAKKELGWMPTYSNDDMLKSSYKWYCDNRDIILRENKNRSKHQSMVKQGILGLLKYLL
tara:strand:- start:979 stop:2025 length:1047 start_codon:yes stop_codon:yes gene_type:complete